MELKLAILFVWVGLAFVVGVTASRRGRDGINWFMLSTIISPAAAGALVLALPPQEPFDGEIRFEAPRIEQDLEPLDFLPDGYYGDIPYRVTTDNKIDAVVGGELFRFQTMEHFLAATDRIAA